MARFAPLRRCVRRFDRVEDAGEQRFGRQPAAFDLLATTILATAHHLART